MKKNTLLTSIYTLILILIIGVPFAFGEWNQSLIADEQVLVMYIIAKVIFGLLFILTCLCLLLAKHARGIVYQASIIIAFFQIVPLVIRLAVFLPSFKLGFSLIILIISLIIYIGYFGLLIISDKKQLASLNKYKGKEIDIREEINK